MSDGEDAYRHFCLFRKTVLFINLPHCSFLALSPKADSLCFKTRSDNRAIAQEVAYHELMNGAEVVN